MFSVGSGMTYAYGVLDTFYRWDLTLEEAVELGNFISLIVRKKSYLSRH